MRVLELSEYGGSLRIGERAEPEPGPGQVRVRVAAAALNPIDRFTATGAFAGWAAHIPLPVVLGTDVSGVVDAVGPDTSFEVGEQVAGFSAWFQQGVGTFAESVVLPQEQLARVPVGTDLELAAAVPLAGLTAQQALDLTSVQPGQRLLVSGGSGAVGGFAVQLANAAGIRVVAVASSGDEDRVRGLGAAQVLPRDSDLVAAVRQDASIEGVQVGGVDAVLDAAPVGPQLIAAVRDGGAFVTVLDSALPETEREIRTVKVSAAADAKQLTHLLGQLSAGRLQVAVAARFPLAEATAAFDLSAQPGARGKVLLVP